LDDLGEQPGDINLQDKNIVLNFGNQDAEDGYGQ